MNRPGSHGLWRLLTVLGMLLALALAGVTTASAAPSPGPSPSASKPSWPTPSPKPWGPPSKSASPSPSSTNPSVPTKVVPTNPCDQMYNTPIIDDGLNKLCKEGYKLVCQPPDSHNVIQCSWQMIQTDSSGNGGSQADCSVLQGTPRQYCEQGRNNSGSDTGWLGNLTGDCKSPPTPSFPTSGVSGWIAFHPAQTAPFLDPSDPSASQHIYEQYGYAGLSWDVYDLGCGGPVLRDQGAGFDNWMGNQAFGIAKVGVALSNSLHSWATDGHVTSALEPVVRDGSDAVNKSIYVPWIGVSVLILGVTLIWGARRRDLPGAVNAVGWALMVMTLATVTIDYPVQAANLANSVMVSTVGTIDADMNQTPGTTDPAIAQANLLTNSVLYQNWLRGELGSADSPTAKAFGMPLLDSQAMTWAQADQPVDVQAKIVDAKEAEFRGIAQMIKDTDPDAYEHLTGHSSNRFGSGATGVFSMASTSPFQGIGSTILIFAELFIDLIVVVFPLVGVIGLHPSTRGVARTAGKAAMAALVNTPMFAVLAGLDALAARTLLGGQDVHLPTWLTYLILFMLTCTLWAISKPFRRLAAMVSPNRNYFGEGASGISRARDRAMRTAASRFSYGNRYLRRMSKAQRNGNGAAGTGRAGGGAPPQGGDEQVWTVPIGHVDPTEPLGLPPRQTFPPAEPYDAGWGEPDLPIGGQGGGGAALVLRDEAEPPSLYDTIGPLVVEEEPSAPTPTPPRAATSSNAGAPSSSSAPRSGTADRPVYTPGPAPAPTAPTYHDDHGQTVHVIWRPDGPEDGVSVGPERPVPYEAPEMPGPDLGTDVQHGGARD